MPRNGAGTYTLPAGNPVITNTNITADWGNDTMEDIGNELTNSLSREGDGGMNAPLRFTNGDINAPGIAWVAETNTGFYYAGPGEFWVTVLGTDVVQFTDNGLLIPTGIDLTVQGEVSLEGALNVVGNFSVDTNKFTVAAATGNTTVAGTFVSTGAITATGGVTGNITSSSVTITGGTINGVVIGGTTAGAGSFTTLATSSGLTGNVTGNVTGDLTGNVTASSGTSTFTNVTVNTGLDMTNGIIANLATPVSSTDAATKAYVDSIAGVTSVALSAPAVFTVSGSPVSTTGTLALTYSGTALPEANGGTAQTTYTTGDFLYASGSNTLSKLAVGTTGQVLTVAAGLPSWATDTTTGTVTSVGLSAPAFLTVGSSPVTSSGTLALTFSGTAIPAANGGTAQTTYSTGDLLYASGANTLSKLAIGTSSQVLTVTAGVPAWEAVAGTGTVTSVDMSGGTTGLTTSGGPVTSSGTITLAGTLAAVNGGTAQTTYATGDLLYASGANTLAKLGIGTAAQVLTVTSGVPAWGSAGGAGTVTSVAQSFTGGLISVSGSPITSSGTLALSVAGTSGGIPYFSSASTWATSAALTQYGVVYGGGAGATPVATAAGTTGQVLTATTSGAPSWTTLVVSAPAGAIIYTANNFGGF